MNTATFREHFDQCDWNEIRDSILGKTASDVEYALSKSKRDLEDFKALISPAASPYLEQMALMSNQLTQKRFGKTIQLYIPMYVSNICHNACSYCGFRLANDLERTVLSEAEIHNEIKAIKSYGFDHILLVSGEAGSVVGVDYFKKALNMVRPHFSHVAMEVQPLETEEYRELVSHGLNAVLVYQETYNKENYKLYHPKGRKSDFYYRLETADRLGRAGLYKIGLGILLGLEDWRADSYFVAMHLKYLEKTYWRTKYSISFPRLRPAKGFFKPNYPVADRDLVQIICAYRLLDQEVELSLSTRESPTFRDNVIRLGITTMSAGSKNSPGGYASSQQSLEQFDIYDDRPPAEIAETIKNRGYEVIWKDWDALYG